jgi:hypothetical protein
MNVLRWNLAYGIPDMPLNIVMMLFGRAALTSLCVMPMIIQMMQVCPKNIEASMFAILSACISFSIEWGGDLTGGFVCDLMAVDENNLGNLHRAIQLKMVTIVLCIGMIKILPLNAEIKDLN